jgi:hypothetical protein
MDYSTFLDFDDSDINQALNNNSIWLHGEDPVLSALDASELSHMTLPGRHVGIVAASFQDNSPYQPTLRLPYEPVCTNIIPTCFEDC